MNMEFTTKRNLERFEKATKGFSLRAKRLCFEALFCHLTLQWDKFSSKANKLMCQNKTSKKCMDGLVNFCAHKMEKLSI